MLREHTTPAWVYLGGLALTVTAGVINAVGFLGVHHQALSHLTGTVTVLGMELGRIPQARNTDYVIDPMQGRITFKGTTRVKMRPHVAASQGIARTFQNIRLFKEAPAIDNVMGDFHRHETCSLLASILALSSARADTARQLLQGFGLQGLPHQGPQGAASGQQARTRQWVSPAPG